MAAKNPIYDLMLLLTSTAEADVRSKILSDTEATIQASGEIVSKHDWGIRPTAFIVDKKTDAEYHLIQFHGPRELLSSLEHTLRITDGVLRFRIIKLAPGVGTPPDLHATPDNIAVGGAPAEEAGSSDDAPRDRDRDAAPRDIESAPA